MSSSYYLNLKNKYISVKGQIQNVIGYFDGCSSSILELSSCLEELIIDGKTFDDGKLDDYNSKLNDIKNNLLLVINECNEKIKYYENLYYAALNKECELANSKKNVVEDN